MRNDKLAVITEYKSKYSGTKLNHMNWTPIHNDK